MRKKEGEKLDSIVPAAYSAIMHIRLLYNVSALNLTLSAPLSTITGRRYCDRVGTSIPLAGCVFDNISETCGKDAKQCKRS